MRKTIIITSLILSGLIILDSVHAGQALVMFLLAGEVPGTTIVLSGARMMELFSLLTGFVVARIANYFIMPLLQRVPVRNLRRV